MSADSLRTPQGVRQTIGTRHAGQVLVDSFGEPGPVYLEVRDGSGRGTCQELAPTAARRVAAALFAAANDIEGKPIVIEAEAA